MVSRLYSIAGSLFGAGASSQADVPSGVAPVNRAPRIIFQNLIKELKEPVDVDIGQAQSALSVECVRLFPPLDPRVDVDVIPRDGNCLFTALARFLGRGRTHADVRRLVADHAAKYLDIAHMRDLAQEELDAANDGIEIQLDRELSELERAYNCGELESVTKAGEDVTAVYENQKKVQRELHPRIPSIDALIHHYIIKEGFFCGLFCALVAAGEERFPIGVVQKNERGGYHYLVTAYPVGSEDKAPCILLFYPPTRESAPHYDLVRPK